MNQTQRHRILSRGITAAFLAGVFHNFNFAAGSVLDCLTPNGDGIGYDQFAWTTMTADLNSANGSLLATTSDLSNLSLLMSYTGLWVDVRQPGTGTLTATETANLQTFIASGRRVVLIGGAGPEQQQSNFSSWNDAILTAAGASAGTTFFSSTATPAYATSPVTTSVSSIAVPSGAVVSSGVTLFADRVATVWGPARNALVVLDSTTLDDDFIGKNSDAMFAGNLASWVAGGETDGACLWVSSTGGGWQDSSRWQLSEQPSIADDATFNLSSPGYTVTVSSPVTARNLIVQNDHPTLNMATASANLTLAQGITIGSANGSSSSLTLTDSTGTGSAALSATSVSVAANASLSISGGILNTDSLVANGAVCIAGGTLDITVAASHGKLNTIHSLTLSGNGDLDLANTDLDLQTGSLADITVEIRSGCAAGTWTGTGISSAAAASDTAHLTALGVIQNGSTYGSAAGSLGTFDGINPAPTDILVKYTYYGDANLDGQVDGSDYTKIDNGFNNHLTGWANGDFNYDGIVDGSDYTLIDNAFNNQAASLAAVTSQISATGTVPEPAGVGILAVLGFALARRKRQRTGGFSPLHSI
jgi:hypothetical protein